MCRKGTGLWSEGQGGWPRAESVAGFVLDCGGFGEEEWEQEGGRSCTSVRCGRWGEGGDFYAFQEKKEKGETIHLL